MEYAFFDVDNTILNIKSMFSFQDYYISKTATIPDAERSKRSKVFYDTLNRYREQNCDRKAINRKYYEFFSGRSKEETTRMACDWFFHTKEASNQSLYIQPVVEQLRALKKSGVEVVFVSGSCHEILRPVMDDLEVTECISTTLEVINGTFTGKISGRQIIGDGKADSLRDYAASKSIDLSGCYAFGDHISDIEMLSTVGIPVVVEGDQKLEKIAKEKSWRIIWKNPAHNRNSHH